MVITRILLAATLCLPLVGLCPETASGQAFPPSQTAAPAVGDPVTPTPSTSPWGWLPMPKVTMPKVTMPKMQMPQLGMPKMPENLFGPAKASAAKVTSGAKKAWEGTRELFSFGGGAAGSPEARVASNQPSIWKRMFQGEAEPSGPQTIGEFMDGERLK